MTSPRRTLIDLDSTPYYHCIACCVRRAFLCGEDSLTGNSYEHRKPWVVDRLKRLASIFAIEVCAYAVMSNHYHVVLHVDAQTAKSWSDWEVLQRWTKLFDGPLLVQQFLAGKILDQAQQQRLTEYVTAYRQRLGDISWFMRCLNEYLARKANGEDGCKGRFWEGRFKSQALLDEAAVLSCMAYVDLNPVRAGLTNQPEDSEFTSIKERIEQWRENRQSQAWLKPMKTGDVSDKSQGFIPFALADYFEFVDWSGRAVREDKRGAITSSLPPVLQRLGIDANEWLKTLRPNGNQFIRGIGRKRTLQIYAEKVGKRWLHGLYASKRLFA